MPFSHRPTEQCTSQASNSYRDLHNMVVTLNTNEQTNLALE
jgi:hypothetical protein